MIAKVGMHTSLTFAISAQLFPASLIVFNLCSSAGVQGVFVRLFFAGGPIGEEVMLGSSAVPIGGAEPDGIDMAKLEAGCPGARLLIFLGRLDGEVSGLTDGSAAAGRGCEGGIPVLGASSGLSARFDIGRRL